MALSNTERQARYRTRASNSRKELNSLRFDIERVDEILLYVNELISGVENGEQNVKSLMIPRNYISYARKILNSNKQNGEPTC